MDYLRQQFNKFTNLTLDTYFESECSNDLIDDIKTEIHNLENHTQSNTQKLHQMLTLLIKETKKPDPTFTYNPTTDLPSVPKPFGLTLSLSDLTAA